jgi:hypothetical protein
VLGDLPEVLSRVLDVLGASARVTSARVQPPQEAQVLPAVELEVGSTTEAARLRGEVEGCEFVSVFDPSQQGPCWSCLVAGVRLTVHVTGDEA